MRADRLLSIMLLLQVRGKMTAQRLAEELEVSRRTILRDIDALSAAGVPVYAEGGHGGGITLDEQYRTALAGMMDKEIRTLFVSDNSQLLSEIGMGEAAERTMLKLRAVLPASHQPSVEHMRQRILIDPVWWWRDTQPLPGWELLQQAVFEDRCIRVLYERRSGEVVKRTLEPYSLVAKSSIWYLVANHADDRDALRTYRILRLRQIILLDAQFQRRPGFDLPTYWQQQLQQFQELTSDYGFTLHIHPDGLNVIKAIVPGRYHQVEPAGADGWMTMQFHLESLILAKMLVFGLGRLARVVEPLELEEAVLNTARSLLKQHAAAPNHSQNIDGR